ncbi:MAG: hypothetical protein ACM3XM_06430 [Mycobacterium leprae]
MNRSSLVLVALAVACFVYLVYRPTPSPLTVDYDSAAALSTLLSQPVTAVLPYSDWDLAEVARNENVMPNQLRARLTEEEVGFLVGFGQSVSTARQAGAQWDAMGHISDLNRYAFLIERVQRNSDRFEAGTVRRIYARFGFTTIYLSNAQIEAMATMGPEQLIRWLNGITV